LGRGTGEPHGCAASTVLLVGCLASEGIRLRSFPSLSPLWFLFPILVPKEQNREQALSFSSPKNLCSIQVRDQALVTDLESFKSISSLSSPFSIVVLILERI
jgi:hypothetical protein